MRIIYEYQYKTDWFESMTERYFIMTKKEYEFLNSILKTEQVDYFDDYDEVYKYHGFIRFDNFVLIIIKKIEWLKEANKVYKEPHIKIDSQTNRFRLINESD